MKKRWNNTLFSIISICILLSLLTSCNRKLISPTNPLGVGDKAGQEMSEEVMGYLKTGDKESLKAMFCDALKNSDDFDEKIDEVMNFIDGEIISYKNEGGSGGRGQTWERIYPGLTDIETDTGKYYHIYMSVYIENDDPSKLGMHQFQIHTLEDINEYGFRPISDENKVILYIE